MSRWVVFGAPAVAALVVACLGDDPTVRDPPAADAAVDAANPTTTGDADTPDAVAPIEKRLCSLSDRDGGAEAGAAPQARWNATPPESAGVPSIAASLVHRGCKIDVATVAITPPATQPSTAVLLVKTDAPNGTCSEPKGFRVLGTTYGDPAVVVASHSFDPRLFVVAHSERGPSGSATNRLTVGQYDFTTGDKIHGASLVVAGMTGGPVGPSRADQLTLLGCNLILRGAGTFPGATGTNDGTFIASYEGFIAPEPQPPSPANEASY